MVTVNERFVREYSFKHVMHIFFEELYTNKYCAQTKGC